MAEGGRGVRAGGAVYPCYLVKRDALLALVRVPSLDPVLIDAFSQVEIEKAFADELPFLIKARAPARVLGLKPLLRAGRDYYYAAKVVAGSYLPEKCGLVELVKEACTLLKAFKDAVRNPGLLFLGGEVWLLDGATVAEFFDAVKRFNEEILPQLSIDCE